MPGPRTAHSRAIRLAPLILLAGLAGGVLAHPGRAVAGNVVVLRSRVLGPYDAAIEGFESAYKGRVTRFTIEDTGAANLAVRVGALRPDAIVAMGLRAALYARDHFPRTPVVFCGVQDPERNELGGTWITGVTTEVPQSVELAMLKTTVPDVHRLAVFYGRATGAEFARGARAAAAAAGLELVEVALGDLSELAVKAREAAAHADAMWLPADPTVAASEPFNFLLRLSLEQRKPLFVFSDALVRAGALAAVTPDYALAGAQAGEAVRRIQAGERAGDIPVSTVRRTRLVVNEATARALGRELPLAVRRDGKVVP